MIKKDLLIIGAGPCGLYAWKLAKDKNISCVILDLDQQIGGQPLKMYPNKNITNLPYKDGIKGVELMKIMYEDAKGSGSEDVALSTSIKLVEDVIDDGFDCLKVTLSNKSEYIFKRILVCVGFGKIGPVKFVDENIENIAYRIEDAKYIDDNEVVVLGGGTSAFEYAMACSHVSKKVTLIHRRDEFRAEPSTVAKTRELGVNIITDSVVTDHLIENDFIKQITIENNKTKVKTKIDLNQLIVAFGISNNKAIKAFKGIEYDEKSNYIVNEKNQTHNKKIYAAGDCCIYPGKIKNIVASSFEAHRALLNIELDINNRKKIVKSW